MALLLSHRAAVDEEVLWDALRVEYNPNDEVVKLLLAYKPELIESVDRFSDDTVLHRVFARRESRDGTKTHFSEELMQMVWEMSLPDTLRRANSGKLTPFHVAIHSGNRFAMELVVGKLFLEEVVSAFAYTSMKCPWYILDKFRECLLLVLNQDVLGMVGEFLGCGKLAKRTNKRRRNDEEDEDDSEA